VGDEYEWCYHPINYGNQLMTWISWILSVSSVLLAIDFSFHKKKKEKEERKEKEKRKKEKKKKKKEKEKEKEKRAKKN
jgi:uncharacterized protein YlxW (UPF0749 family)